MTLAATVLPPRAVARLGRSAGDDMATTMRLLRQVAAGRRPATLRLYEPGPTVAFSRRETHLPGFAAAGESARRHGFAPVLRHAGGRAVAFGTGCLIVELVAPDGSPATQLTARFEAFAVALRDALRSLGVDAAVGSLAGEYCPGDHSIIGSGRIKLAGIAQRLVARAWLCTASIVVSHAAPLRAVLTDVYRDLAFDWRPATLGAVTDLAPDVTAAAIEAALLRRLGGLVGPAWP